MAEKPIDPRIGKHGEYEPEICAVTGHKAPRDVACTNVSLGNGYYYRVLAKVARQHDRDATKVKLEKVLSGLAGSQPKVVNKSSKRETESGK